MKKLMSWLRRVLPPRIEPAEPARPTPRPGAAGGRRSLHEAAHKRVR